MSTNSIKPCSKQVTLKQNNGECGSHRGKQFCELLTGISRGSNTSFTEITKHAPTRIGNNWSVGPQAIMDVAKKTKLERTNQYRSQKKKNLVWIVSLFSVIFNFRKSYTWFSQPLLALRVWGSFAGVRLGEASLGSDLVFGFHNGCTGSSCWSWSSSWLPRTYAVKFSLMSCTHLSFAS